MNTVLGRRITLVVIAALAGLSYAWDLGRDPLEPYYQAAVRSMSMSWHNFAFGAFDPAGTTTLDKLPGAFWVQALAVRALGFHPWVIVAPQAIEGVLTVLVLYHAVQRLAGPAAGLIAALVLAASPATVALNRGNISDSLMILLLVLAADAVSGAIAGRWRPGPVPSEEHATEPDTAEPPAARHPGRRHIPSGIQGRLILAAVWVGLAFQAKMTEAWLILPALGLAYLLSGPRSTLRRVRQLAVAGVVAGVVSLSWMTVVSLVPASHRPAVDGSQHNSLYEQVFVYNGFGRLGDHTPLQLLAAQAPGLGNPAPAPAAGPGRLLSGDLGHDTGWLLPAALVTGAWGIVSRRRPPRRDGPRAAFVLWGGWLVTLGVTFSVTSAINPYYTAALTPAVAAILGAGVAALWPAGRAAGARLLPTSPPKAPQPAALPPLASLLPASPLPASPPLARQSAAPPPVAPQPSAWQPTAWQLGLAVVVAGTAAYAAWLVPGTGTGVPGWLVPSVIVVGALATATILASAVTTATNTAAPKTVSAARTADVLLRGALAAGLVAMLLAPATAAAELVARHGGTFDTPFEPASEASALDLLFVQTPQQVAAIVPNLQSVSGGSPDLLATQTSAVASVFINASGQEALPIGGFTGSSPAPTLSQLQADIRAGAFHWVLANTLADPRLRWVAAHCRPVNQPGRVHLYYCLPQNAA